MKKLNMLMAALFALTLASCGETEVSSEEVSESTSASTSTEAHSVDLDLGDIPTYDEESVCIHYYRKDGTYTGWDLWLWEKGGDGAGYDWNGKDDWGVAACYPLSTWDDVLTNSLGFIIRKGGSSWTDKDCGGNDLFIDFSVYGADANACHHIYMVSGDSNIYTDTEGTVKGAITMCTFAYTAKRGNYIAVTANLGIASWVLTVDGVETQRNDAVGGATRAYITVTDAVDFGAKYVVTATLKNGDTISATATKYLLYNTDPFNEAYAYDGDDLGAVYTSASTTFKVWSPFSDTIELRIYDSGTPASLNGSDVYTAYEMTLGDKGVWSSTVTGDLAGKDYTYVVTNYAYTAKEVVDPYAKSAGVNGLRGMIVDFDKTNPDGWDDVDYLAIDRKAMTVYEVMVPDLTSSSTWGGTASNAKKFAGMVEEGTTYTDGSTTVKTGFDHIKELGVNAVQIGPFFDQANDEVNMSFNWGYNPLNYNVLEGGYSSDPYDGYTRIKEFKNLVKAYNEAGISIIMDVVYNHVNSVDGQCFDVLMPDYYFRHNSNGTLSNGSGCGNETACENYMFAKFIKDSVCFWTEEYKLGGFRFDLMALHTLDVMEEVTAAATAINPNLVIYGEPWAGGTSAMSDYDTLSARQANGNSYVGYGCFNDQMRDALIKGGLNGATDKGFVTDYGSSIATSDKKAIMGGVQGTIYNAAYSIADPDKTVNYVTCHDNYTLYDRILATKQFDATSASDLQTVKEMAMLANSIVLTSQGTSFMLAGEEFLRTKQMNSNSYNASYKVNELNYALKVTNIDMFENYQKLIALKQNLDGLHLDKTGATAVAPTFNDKGSLVSYALTDSANGKTYQVYHANGLASDLTVDLSGYTLYLDTLDSSKTLSSATTLSPYETIIAYC